MKRKIPLRLYLICLLISLPFGTSLIKAQPLVQIVSDGVPLPEGILFDSTDNTLQPGAAKADEGSDYPFNFWIGGGFGYGSADKVCPDCDETERPGGSTFQGALGFALTPRILIGLETAIWVDGWGLWNSSGRKIYSNHLLLMSYWYPLKRSRLFAKFGAGLSSYTAYDRYVPYTNFLPSEVHGEGLGMAAGLGYDLKISRRLCISPTVAYFYGFLGDLELNNSSVIAANGRLSLVTINAALTFRAPK